MWNEGRRDDLYLVYFPFRLIPLLPASPFLPSNVKVVNFRNSGVIAARFALVTLSFVSSVSPGLFRFGGWPSCNRGRGIYDVKGYVCYVLKFVVQISKTKHALNF